MPKYTPPPPSLDHLNPIQRYLQKGKLEFQDYVNLLLVVGAYFILRPYIDAAMKKIFGKDIKEGEEAQQDYVDSKTKPKVGANEIRGAKTTAVAASAQGATGADIVPASVPVNRKSKVTDEVPPPTAEQLLEWSDIVTTGTTEGGKSDILTWVDNWD